ncbi:MAG: cytochrome c oxidase assembly protein [Pseudomonadota bacterium]
MRTQVKARNLGVAALAVGAAAAMVGMAYAAVPFYRWFCQVTGFGGTTQVAVAADKAVAERVMRIRFSGSVNRGMPWDFAPKQQVVSLKVGEQGLAYYRARNRASETVTGQATFNVTPFKAGPYFVKVACFCFTEQTLGPGEEADMPVSFYVDPDIVDDPRLDDVTEITLNYTFFRHDAPLQAKTAARHGDESNEDARGG